MAPLQGERTQSFLSRVAARYGVGLRDLLAAIAEVGGLSNVTGQTRLDSEGSSLVARESRHVTAPRVRLACRAP